jgi:hypothetical protein
LTRPAYVVDTGHPGHRAIRQRFHHAAAQLHQQQQLLAAGHLANQQVGGLVPRERKEQAASQGLPARWRKAAGICSALPHDAFSEPRCHGPFAQQLRRPAVGQLALVMIDAVASRRHADTEIQLVFSSANAAISLRMVVVLIWGVQPQLLLAMAWLSTTQGRS